jgi:MYXO-CTERM domain-containing protein
MFAYGRNMKRALLSLAAVVAWNAGGPRVAEAQTDTTTTPTNLIVKLLKVGDSEYNSNSNKPRPISKAECEESGLELTFRIDGLGVVTNPEFLEVWVGENCERTERKDADKDPCTPVADEELDSTLTSIPGFKVPVDELCAVDGKRTLHFLGVDSTNSSGAAKYAGTFAITIDKSAPNPPTDVNGGSGETQIPVSWDAPSGEVDHYLLVWDDAVSDGPSAGTGGSDDDGGTAALQPGPSACRSTRLLGGDDLGSDVDEFPSGLDGKRVDGNVEKTTLDGTDFRSKVAAVGVIAVDLAGNASVVSELACIRVVPTTGFWDKYQTSAGAVDEGCACSLPGSGASASGAWPVLLALGTLLMRARRRRS